MLTVLLTLQKLVRLSSEDKSDIESSGKSRWQKLRRHTFDFDDDEPDASLEKPTVQGFVSNHNLTTIARAENGFKTLQQYRGGRNVERIMYMERHSALTDKGFAVSVEQVAIFLTNDNTVICFFEHSADDIEGPILKRLDSQDTILRRSCDASMMVQAVIDAVIDLAIPITAAYEDVMSDLELDVLTDPDIEHSKSLYILTSELQLLRNSIHPIGSLISALRDHRTEPANTGESSLVESKHELTLNSTNHSWSSTSSITFQSNHCYNLSSRTHLPRRCRRSLCHHCCFSGSDDSCHQQHD